jgi:hypothetical protein
MIDTGGIVVIYVDRKHGNAYYDRYRNNWIMCAVEHEEGRALHLDKKSGALVCYGYGHENNYIRGRKYRILEIDVDGMMMIIRDFEVDSRTYYHRTVLPIMEKRKCGSSYDH